MSFWKSLFKQPQMTFSRRFFPRKIQENNFTLALKRGINFFKKMWEKILTF